MNKRGEIELFTKEKIIKYILFLTLLYLVYLILKEGIGRIINAI